MVHVVFAIPFTMENTLRLNQAKQTMLRCPYQNAQAYISIRESIGVSA